LVFTSLFGLFFNELWGMESEKLSREINIEWPGRAIGGIF